MTDVLDVVKAFKTDREKQREGIWEEIPLAEGVALEVKVASAATRAYKNKLADLLEPFQHVVSLCDRGSEGKQKG